MGSVLGFCLVQVTHEILKLHLGTGVHKSPAPGRRADNFTVMPKTRGSSALHLLHINFRAPAIWR